MNPILLDLPEEYETERLTIRVPRPGDGTAVQAAYVEAGDHIYRWARHANPQFTREEVEELMRTWRAEFLTRERFNFLLFSKGTDTFVGEISLHHIEWEIPKFEIGFLVRPCFEGQGFISEAVGWVTDWAFATLGARRIEIWHDTRNERSQRVAERAGYTFEGILHNIMRDREGHLCDARVYAQFRMDG